MLEKKEIEKDRFLGLKDSIGRGYGQSAEAMANQLNQLGNWSTGCPCSIENQSRDAQSFLFLPIVFSSCSSYSLPGRGSVEVQSRQP